MRNLNLIFHHVGIAVDSIEDAILSYAPVFGSENISKKILIQSQMVNVCFINTGESTYLELVEASNENSSISRIRKKGVSYYHTGYFSDSIESDVIELEKINFKAMDFFNSEAFENRRCIFLISPEGHLIELIEK